MPYWMLDTLAATPAFAWIYLGLGLIWALALLPRRDWRDQPLLLALAFALGPGLLTLWMFILGTLGTAANPLLRFDLVLGGMVVLALAGAIVAWRKRRPVETPPPRQPLAFDEKLLLILIGLALVIRWVGVAYWPFTAYDALWVYGYEGRLYTLVGHIPATIDYYPQFLPLQFTYGQLAIGGISDHAARAVLPFLHSGAILAVYALGSRLLTRRAGIIAAALWALYPHVGEWSRFGDLEIPLTFLFTLAAAFFLMAWTGQPPRRRYALLAGLVFGITLWTKPTAGAFVWGVLLLLALDFIRVRFEWRAWWPRFQIALITGLASAPLGVAWYARNALLGHEPVVLPPPFWQTLAAQSGIEWGWPLLALLVLAGYLYLGGQARPALKPGLIGLALALAGLLPSMLSPHRMGVLEWLLLGAGAVVLYFTFAPFVRRHWGPRWIRLVDRVGWALALAVPYFVTWFFSYSYHYRLSFAIVPLLLLPLALVLSWWLEPKRLSRPVIRWVYAVWIVGLALNGLIIPLYDANAGWDWLWTDKLPDDSARYRSGNEALMDVVHGLQIYLDEHDETEPLVVVAPGMERLPFFFPLEDIRIDTAPTTFDQLNGVVYFIDSHPEGTGAYEGVSLFDNQILSALERPDVMRHAWWKDDGIFRYDVYELHLENRFDKPFLNAPAREEVIFGDFTRFMGYDTSGDTFWPGRKLFTHFYWYSLGPAPEDYSIYVHLMAPDGTLVATWDNPVARSEDGLRYYSTLVWESKEYIWDERILQVDDPALPEGGGYQIVIGFYNAAGERVPVTIDGKPSGMGYTLDQEFFYQPAAPEN